MGAKLSKKLAGKKTASSMTGDEDLTYLETVGNTPLVRLHKVLPEEAKVCFLASSFHARGTLHNLTVCDLRTQDARVLIKLEMQNPGGSVKDRIAKSMIEAAEAQGKLTPGKSTVVEYTR
eukprot:scaffold7449_cov430-Prasinococcus_capsulatus_cf.AAC.6